MACTNNELPRHVFFLVVNLRIPRRKACVSSVSSVHTLSEFFLVPLLLLLLLVGREISPRMMMEPYHGSWRKYATVLRTEGRDRDGDSVTYPGTRVQ